MTPKEALKKIENYEFNPDDKKIWNRVMGDETFNIGDLISDILDDEFLTIEQALTELEELKRDVKRYFELDNKHGCTLREIDEWLNLERKLMKVGKEE